ncbi:MAG: globin family protein [Chitinophagales bacterium]
MTNQQILLVQDSWKLVIPIKETAGRLFYMRLFEETPALKLLFKGDASEQVKKLMTMLTVIVNNLSRLEQIVPAAKKLAVKHIDYGVEIAYYPKVGSALLWTLEQGLGEAWNEDLKSAWQTAYGTLSRVMIEAHQKAVNELQSEKLEM